MSVDLRAVIKRNTAHGGYSVFLEMSHRSRDDWHHLGHVGSYRKLGQAEVAARESLADMRARLDDDPDRDIVEIIPESR